MSERRKDRLIPWQEAADRLALSTCARPQRVICQMGKRGELETRKVGKELKVVERSVDRIIDGTAA